MVQVLFRSCNVSLVERVELHNSVSIVEWTHTEEKLRFCGFLTFFSRNLNENWIFECNLFCKNGIQLKINSMHAHCSHFFVDLSFILWIIFSNQSNLDPILWDQKKVRKLWLFSGDFRKQTYLSSFGVSCSSLCLQNMLFSLENQNVSVSLVALNCFKLNTVSNGYGIPLMETGDQSICCWLNLI